MGAGSGVVVEDCYLARRNSALYFAGYQVLYLDYVVPVFDSLLGGFPDVGGLVVAGYFFGVDNVEVGAADGFVVDFAALVAGVGAADGSDVHSFFY